MTQQRENFFLMRHAKYLDRVDDLVVIECFSRFQNVSSEKYGCLFHVSIRREINIKEKYETSEHAWRKIEMVPSGVYANVVLKSAQNTNIPPRYVTSNVDKAFL